MLYILQVHFYIVLPSIIWTNYKIDGCYLKGLKQTNNEIVLWLLAKGSKNDLIQVHTKGQLISICLITIFNSPKNERKHLTLLLWYLKLNCFRSFHQVYQISEIFFYGLIDLIPSKQDEHVEHLCIQIKGGNNKFHSVIKGTKKVLLYMYITRCTTYYDLYFP